MSTTIEALSPEEQISALKAQIAVLTARKPNRVVAATQRVGRAVWAAVASTDAVKKEKSLAVLVAVRLLVSAGAADGIVKLVQTILKSAGWS